MKVLCKRIGDHTLPLPSLGSEGAAGYDLRANLGEGDFLELRPGETRLIPTGFAYATPSAMAMYLLPRSGLGHKNGIVLGNLVGLIDPDFRDQVFVSAWNRGSHWRPFRINHGDRVAQAVFLPRLTPELVEVDELDATERGAGGFGSTGRG
jgi:dUTP pyrophosphatase